MSAWKSAVQHVLQITNLIILHPDRTILNNNIQSWPDAYKESSTVSYFLHLHPSISSVSAAMRGNWVWLFVMMSMMACAVSYKPLIPQRTHRLSMVKENEGEKAEAILVRSVGQVAKSSLFNFASAVVLSLSVATMRPTSAVAVTTLVADRVLQASDKSLIEGSMRDETGITTSSFVEDIQRNRPLCSDEFQIEFPGAPETLGLKLVEQGYR